MKSYRPTVMAFVLLFINCDCTSAKVAAIRSSGEAGEQIRVEEATTWLTECLLAGRSAECQPKIVGARVMPSFDIGTLSYINDRLGLRVSDNGECEQILRAGRIIGRFVLINPNDDSLERLDDASDGPRSSPHWRLHLDPIAWLRSGKQDRWVSDRVVIELKRYEGFGLDGLISSLPSTPPYEREAESDNPRALTNALMATELAALILPSPVDGVWEEIALSVVLPYEGILAFRAEFMEFRDQRNDPLGCQAVYTP